MILGDYSSIIQGAQDRRDRQDQGTAMNMASLYKHLKANSLNNKIQGELEAGRMDNVESLSRRGIAMGLPTMYSAQEFAELKKQREEQEHQERMHKERLMAEMGLKKMDLRQQDLNKARAQYDDSQKGFQLLIGNINSAREKYLELYKLNPNSEQTASALNTLKGAMEQGEYLKKKSAAFRKFLEDNPDGLITSNYIFTDRTEAAPQAETEKKTEAESNVPKKYRTFDDMLEFIKNYKDAFDPNYELMKEAENIDPNHFDRFEKLMKGQVQSNVSREKYGQQNKANNRADADYDDQKRETKFNREYSEWEKANTTYSALKSKTDDFDINSAKAIEAMNQGNYKGVVEFVKGFTEDAERLSIKIPFVSYKPKSEYTREDAIQALKEYQAGKKIVQDKIEAMEKTKPQRKK